MQDGVFHLFDDSEMTGNLKTTRLKQEEKGSRRVQALVLGKEPVGYWMNGLYFTSHG